MALVHVSKLKNFWEEWNLRVAVLVSLLLQIFLILSASFRRRTGSGVLISAVWLAYLLADWIAAFAVGLISSGQGNDCPSKNSVNKDLAAFWAPFLLLHLGGPDNITAFSLEDNQLWVRHLFGLVIQFLAVLYVFTQSAPNEFWIPTVVLTFAGTVKYAERTRALYSACLSNFKKSMLPKPDAGPNYAQLMDEFSSIEAQVPVEIEKVAETYKSSTSFIPPYEDLNALDDDFMIVKNAYEQFRVFRGLIVDHMFSFEERDKSRSFFFKRIAKDAFRVMEIELNFMYDALYTKAAMMHGKRWFALRFTCSILLVFSCVYFSHQTQKINKFDLGVSYTLLIGGICLDFASHVKVVFSDWTVALLNNLNLASIVSLIHRKISLGSRSRWSNSISQHSLINYCLKEQVWLLVKMSKLVGLEDLLDEWVYKGSVSLEKDFTLKEFIFKEIRDKAEKAEHTKSAKEIYSARGEYILSEYTCHYPCPSIAASLNENVEFDESVLLWHIATDLCYQTSISDPDPSLAFCKLLSDYMLYLITMRPTLMSAVSGIAKIRFQDTCAEARKFFQRERSKKSKHMSLCCCCCRCRRNPDLPESEIIEACEKLLGVKTVVKPVEVKGDKSKSVLFDACMLAKDLKEIKNPSKRWEMMSRVWVELLCYAASHCRASSHAEQLSQGGELLTFAWLLMAHFGLGEQFRVEAGHIRAKLIVGK